MALKTRIIWTDTTDPWWNLSMEEYLLDTLEKGSAVLYLWQNQNTVVIGKNQNAWRECRTELLENEGGKLARRLSGGGAVFHDLGNLNFTFLVNREDYSLERQVGVILSAVRKVGINAEMTGRNDITVEGRKFSGNAFCFRKENAYHHGTILVSADMGKLGRYLQVSPEKIKAKGIQSVQARVTNLVEYNPSLTIDKMGEAFADAFREDYGGDPVAESSAAGADKNLLEGLYRKYSSWEWRYGETPKFDITLEERFSWGGIEIGLGLEKGVITKASVYSDALDGEFVEMLPAALKDAPFRSSEMAARIRGLTAEEERLPLVEDIAAWLERKGF